MLNNFPHCMHIYIDIMHGLKVAQHGHSEPGYVIATGDAMVVHACVGTVYATAYASEGVTHAMLCTDG